MVPVSAWGASSRECFCTYFPDEVESVRTKKKPCIWNFRAATIIASLSQLVPRSTSQSVLVVCVSLFVFCFPVCLRFPLAPGIQQLPRPGGNAAVGPPWFYYGSGRTGVDLQTKVQYQPRSPCVSPQNFGSLFSISSSVARQKKNCSMA